MNLKIEFIFEISTWVLTYGVNYIWLSATTANLDFRQVTYLNAQKGVFLG